MADVLDYQTPRPEVPLPPPPPPPGSRPGVTRVVIGGLTVAGSSFFIDPQGSGWDNACPSTFWTAGMALMVWGTIRLIMPPSP